MRFLLNGLVASSCVLSVALGGCHDRRLRPLTPCTTSGVSITSTIAEATNVDLLFMVDNSGSMREEQAKLREQFPALIEALLTGRSGTEDYQPVQSLRVAVVTSDLGVAGVGHVPGTTMTKISTCGAFDPERAHYGDDGALRLQGRSAPASSSGALALDCDFDGDGTDDSVAAAGLPSFLTFDHTASGSTSEFANRVACFTNVGTSGCAYEQQLESVLKALTPSDAASADALPGGRFYHQTDDGIDHSARGLGQGTDTNTTVDDLADVAANGGWLRDDSLLAVVMVSDEDDCSSDDRRVFDYLYSAEAQYDDPYNQYQAQTRCARHPELTFDTDRYVQGLQRLRQGREGLLVFAAITGIPEALTRDVNPYIVEGTENIAEILADPLMQYVYEDELRPAGPGNADIWVPNASLRPACQHVAAGRSYSATADAVDGSITLDNLFVASPIAGPAVVTASGTTTSGSNSVSISSASSEISAGMSISGTGIATGTIVTTVYEYPSSPGQYDVTLSEPASASSTGTPLTIGATFGPAIGQQVTSAGAEIPYATTITSVTGTNPYTVTVSHRVVGTTTGLAVTLGALDVSATPGLRAARVAQGLLAAGAHVTLQSICVDDFGPALGEIQRQIQRSLPGTCLGRSLIRNANDIVTCDVFVTMPPNVDCDNRPGYVAESTVPATNPLDDDGILHRCRITQLPVTAADLTGVTVGNVTTFYPPTGTGWFYDDYTAELAICGDLEQRISFTADAKPPLGATMKFGCIQPVQDGTLRIDLNAPCSVSGTCEFPSQSAYSEFRLRYNMAPRGWSETMPADPANAEDTLQLQCEPNSLTCQIPCTTDANCPGGFVCYDPHERDSDARSFPHCANPICGTGM